MTRRFSGLPLALAILVCTVALASGPRKVKPGFNLFSKQQDVQLGREAATEMEKQLPLVNNRELVDYVNRVAGKLTARPEAEDYPYTFKVVQEDSINAFALPGGPIFVHTGLVTQADNEAQLAGVLAHEIAHVALRHGTNQVSKAQFLQLGAILGGEALAGKGILGQLAGLGVGVGAQSLLLKYSRNAERDADILGMRMLAGAGYNPIEMARFFEKLQAQSGQSSKFAAWFSSHPQPESRSRTLEEEIQYVARRDYTTQGTGELPKAKQLVAGLPPSRPAGGGQPTQTASRGPAQKVEAPAFRHSSRFETFRNREFQFAYPDNWKPAGGGDTGVTVTPPGGLVSGAIGYGAIAGITEVDRRENLSGATQRLIKELQQSNPGLRVDRSARQARVAGQGALMTELTGDSPYLKQTEKLVLVTAPHSSGMFHMIYIYPNGDESSARAVLGEMLRSLRF